MSDIAIKVEGLSKLYKIGRLQRHDTLRDRIADARIFNLFKRRNGHNGGPPAADLRHLTSDLSSSDTIWALKDVSFEVKRGEVIGIIGRNGAGKSTLLKILSRITEPTEGYADINGRIASLLEVGTGFHPELTGRENIFLNGSILGMKRAEIDKKFDEIVAFAEIEKFIDTPVKHYSSGMYVRLAFAVAAHLEPEILLVDEVLAVGDAAFQKKCLGKMGDVAREGRTVLFVSHNMGAIQSLCQRVIWVNDGRIWADGQAKRIVGQYIDSVNELSFQKSSQAYSDREEFTIERVSLRNSEGVVASNFNFGEDIAVEIHYNARNVIQEPYFWISVDSQFGSLFGANMLFDNLRPSHIEGKGSLICVFKNVRLLPQTFSVSMGVRDHTGTRNLIPSAEVAFFRIVANARDMGMAGELADRLLDDSSPLIVSYQWQFMDGRILAPAWETERN